MNLNNALKVVDPECIRLVRIPAPPYSLTTLYSIACTPLQPKWRDWPRLNRARGQFPSPQPHGPARHVQVLRPQRAPERSRCLRSRVATTGLAPFAPRGSPSSFLPHGVASHDLGTPGRRENLTLSHQADKQSDLPGNRYARNVTESPVALNLTSRKLGQVEQRSRRLTV